MNAPDISCHFERQPHQPELGPRAERDAIGYFCLYLHSAGKLIQQNLRPGPQRTRQANPAPFQVHHHRVAFL